MDLSGVRENMEKALTALADELSSVQAGRANPAIVEKMMVDAYNTKMPLVELATISAPEPNQLLVSPFDPTIIKDIQQAITQNKELRFSATIDENVIRVQIPPLTQERREEFVRMLNQKLEIGRVAIRQIRQEKRSEIKQVFEDNQISEDAKFRLEKELQEITDELMEKISQMGQKKEEELLSI